MSDNKSIVVNDPAIRNVVEYINNAKYNDAIRWIQNKAKEEEQQVSRTEKFNAYPADGAYAFTQVLREVYGWIEQKPTMSFWGSNPPTMFVVETSHDSRTEVPWGNVAVPNIEGVMNLGAVNDQGMWKFQLSAVVKKKHIDRVKDLCDKTRSYLKSNSIYRGKPVRLEWVETKGGMFTAEERGFDTPRFLPPSGLQKDDLVLPHVTYEEINATIFSLIEHADLARSMGIPTKRLVLAAGPYGTGKTLTATITAELCRKYNRTFLYLREVEHLADAIYFAQQYAPACVFAEDIDRIASPDTIDRISNTIDGVDTKGLDILFILTTNYPERIPPKFRRNGRTDMVITYTPPDAEAAARLIRKYGYSTLSNSFTDADAMEVATPLADTQMIPASIREVVERAKLFALAYERTVITKIDLQRASHGVIEQCKMNAEKRENALPDHLEEFGTLVRNKNGDAAVSPSRR